MLRLFARFLVVLAALLIAHGPILAAGTSAADFPTEYAVAMRDAMRSFLQRDFPTALAVVEKAERAFRETPISLNIRGAVAIEERRFDEGRKYCIEALRLDPSFFPAQFNLAEIPFVQGKYAEARVLFEKLRDDHEKDDLVQFRIFLTYLLEKNESAAREMLENVPFLSDTPIYYYTHAAWEFAHGNEEEGRKWVDSGNYVFPPLKTLNFSNVFYDLGWLKRPGTSE